MFNIGLPELILILIVALVFVGPDKLPDVARSLGRLLGQVKGALDDVKETIEQEAEKTITKPVKDFEEEVKKEVESFYTEANKHLTLTEDSEKKENNEHDNRG